MEQYTLAYAPVGWKDFFNMEETRLLLKNTEKNIKNEYPCIEKRFAVFRLTRLKDIKVVIIGNEPNINNESPINIFNENIWNNIFTRMEQTVENFKKEEKYDLNHLATEGVFFLNMMLTCDKDKSKKAHQYAWASFVKHFINYICKERSNIVFMLWGKDAQKLKKYITKKHYILECNTPPEKNGSININSIKELLNVCTWDDPIETIKTILYDFPNFEYITPSLISKFIPNLEKYKIISAINQVNLEKLSIDHFMNNDHFNLCNIYLQSNSILPIKWYSPNTYIDDDNILFFDIETTGLSRKNSKITTIVWLYKNKIKKWINGQDNQEFINDYNKSEKIVTFNGKTFDVPFIMEHFKVENKIKHDDLKDILFQYKFKGNLKSLAKLFFAYRHPSIGDINGEQCIFLWYDYQNKNNISSLNKLLYYNYWDVIDTYKLYCKIKGLQFKDYSDQIPAI
jgi:uracil DNA glycosylase